MDDFVRKQNSRVSNVDEELCDIFFLREREVENENEVMEDDK